MMEPLVNILEGFSDQIVWQEIQRRQSNQPLEDKNLKQIEIKTFLAQPEGGIEDDIPEQDFYARALSLDNLEPIFKERIDRIVLVHRLREVVAQVGFTRFEPTLVNSDGEFDEELEIGVRLAAIDLDMSWVPAYENKGEGVFISFSPKAIDEWLAKPTVKKRGIELIEGFKQWKASKGIKSEWLPNLPYIMLHSLSHLLITAISLECGYSASAIRERI